jgi:glycosyltransferase involved in cell wall biosynthesis
MKPLIGILLTTYNDGNIINKCIKSIYFQSYKDIKIVCIDDGSERDVDEFLDFEYLSEKLTIKKIPHSERAVSRDTGIEILKSLNVDYFMFLDSDMTMPDNFITNLVDITIKNEYLGVILPELSYSDYKNFWSKVKVFERNIYRVDAGINSNTSIEAARLWKMDKFPGFLKDLKAFEEIQPTLKARKLGYKIGRANDIYIMHDEKYVSFRNLIKKKTNYFNNMTSHKSVTFKSMLSKFYFFRPQLYHKNNLAQYIKHPFLFSGVITLYSTLTLIAFIVLG